METFLANFYAQTLSVSLRATLLIWGSEIVTASHGAVTTDQTTTAIGAVMVVAGVAWSVIDKLIVAAVVKRLGFGG